MSTMNFIIYIMIIYLSFLHEFSISDTECPSKHFYSMSLKWWFANDIQYQKIVNCSLSCINKNAYFNKPLIINCDYKEPKIKPGCLQKGVVSGIHYGTLFTSDRKLTWTAAVRWCRSRGLELADVQTLDKELELITLINKHPKLSTAKFWIAATDIRKPGDTPYWISDGSKFDSLLNKGNKKPVYFNAIVDSIKNISRLKYSISNNYQEINPFICEYPTSCYTEKCFNPKIDWPTKKIKKFFRYKVSKKKSFSTGCDAVLIPPNECKKLLDEELRDEILKIKDATTSVKVSGGVVIDSCGGRLFFSNVEKSFYESFNICCSMGLKLISIDTYDKMNCIDKLIKRALPSEVTFWTSGYDTKCDGEYIWASLAKPFSLDAPWLPGEPSYVTANFATLFISNKSSGLIDRHGPLSLPYICEGTLIKSRSYHMSDTNEDENDEELKTQEKISTKFPPIILTPKLLLLRPKMPPNHKDFSLTKAGGNVPKMCSIFECTKEEKSINFNWRQVMEKNTEGNLFRKCNKFYFFGKEMIDIGSAARKCCRLGMRVLSINSIEEMDCVHDAFIELHVPGRNYITKALAFQGKNPIINPQIINGSFDNCEKNGPESIQVEDEIWFPAEPNNLSGMEFCTLVRLSPSSARGMHDLGCGGAPFQYFHYACEAEQ